MKTIKSKIFSGFLFLLFVIIALSVIAVVFTNQLAQSSRGSLIDNYRTIDYTTAMLQSLDEMYLDVVKREQQKISGSNDGAVEMFEKARNNFQTNLDNEISNITERGEKELVDSLNSAYSNFLIAADSVKSIYYRQTKNITENIYALNMNSIKAKNTNTEKKAREVIVYTAIAGAISIIATLFFVLVFPSRVVKPLNFLTEKIKAVSQNDYSQKLEVNSKDEIGQLAAAFNIMSGRLKEYEDRQIGELLTANKRLETLVLNMQDGIMVLDNENNVLLANQIMAELSGIGSNELNNKNIADLAQRSDFIREIISPLSANTSTTESEGTSLRIIKNQKEFYYGKEVIPIVLKSEKRASKNAGNMIILKDITRFEERDAAKTKLISTVSHEMKTPVSSINLTLKLLEDTRIGELNKEQKELLQSIKDQSNRLSRVINEILNYSQIESGNIRLNFNFAQPEDIIDYATTALMIHISEKNIQVETYIEDDLPSINMDIEKTVWVLVNLLNNAIRYSSENGKIVISSGRKNDAVFFSVKDYGPGISLEDQSKLFNRFSQLGQKSERGWGLGLAISKEFVQAQGGTISVDSAPGKGSEFRFYLPL